MAESEGTQAIVNQVAIQEATAVMMVFRDADIGPRTTAYTASLRKPLRQTHGRPALENAFI